LFLVCSSSIVYVSSYRNVMMMMKT